MPIKLLYFLTAATSTLFLLYILQPIAVRIGLVDRPRGHKHHQGEIPLVGGLAMFGGFWITVFLLDIACPNKLSFGVASSLLIIIGAWDDCQPLSTWIRLIVQCAAALVMIMGGGVIIENLGNILGFGEILLERWLAIPFTVIAIVGVINATNMIDGLDGLAGSLVALLFLCLIALTASANLASYHLISFILLATIISFLIFNFPLSARKQAKLFIGDSGSMFLGLVVAWFLILLSQKPHNTLAPVIALWLFAIPLFDTVNLLLRRMALGSSPFDSGRDHLHHILLLMGYSSRQTLSIIIAFACLSSLIGLFGRYMDFPQTLLFYGFMGLFAGYCYVTYHIWLGFNSNDRHNLYNKSTPSSYLLQPEFSGYSEEPSSSNDSSDGERESTG